MDYGKHVSTRVTPQSEPIPGSGQVQNSAGGFAWPVDDWTRLDRFLILGNEGGSYYASERKMTKEAASCVERLLKEHGVEVVARIVEVSKAGIAPKNDPAIFALAMAMKKGDRETRRHAGIYLPEVCRTGTHLFQMAEAVQAFGGWGRNTCDAFARWYNAKDVDDLGYQAVKYQQRNGWSHRDILRLAHPKPPNRRHDALYKWIVKGWEGLDGSDRHVLPNIVLSFEGAKEDPEHAIQPGIELFGLPREALPSEALGKAKTWDWLLRSRGGMPMTAMIRNLANMTRLGLVAPMSEATKFVCDRLGDGELLRKARVHPIQVLSALLTYKAGHGIRGQNTWEPVKKVVDALDGAFYEAFSTVVPSGARTLIALDVSGSMSGGDVAGVVGLTPRVASSAMAMVTARAEANYEIMAFSSSFVSLDISPKDRLDRICAGTDRLPISGTDCALPMVWALKNKVPVDTFAVYTDSETWHGGIHPMQALKEYRQKMGIAAKLVVVGMVSNGFSIADPNDAGSMDVVGFDSSAPALIADFSRPKGSKRKSAVDDEDDAE